MLLKELIEKLNQFPMDAEVTAYYRAELESLDEEFFVDAVSVRNGRVTIFGGV